MHINIIAYASLPVYYILLCWQNEQIFKNDWATDI